MGLFSQRSEKHTKPKPPSSMLSEREVLEALKAVMDPDLNQDIVSLGFVKDVLIKPPQISFRLELTTPACPVKDSLRDQCEKALLTLDGITEANVTLSAQTRKAPSLSAPKLNESLSKVKNIVAIASGKGGVAKSTTAVNLAFALSQKGAKVGILDADVYGPSVPLMTGVGNPRKSRAQLVCPPEINGVKVISIAMFGSAKKAAIMRGPMASQVIKQFLSQVDWGELDYLIVDYPPGTGDIQLSLSQLAPISAAVVVTTPQEISLIDVRKAISMFETLKVPVLGIIETMSYFLCQGENKKHYIFGKDGGKRIAEEYGLPLLGQIPIDEQVCLSSDKGKPIVLEKSLGVAGSTYVKTAGSLARHLSVLNSNKNDILEHIHLVWKKAEF